MTFNLDLRGLAGVNRCHQWGQLIRSGQRGGLESSFPACRVNFLSLWVRSTFSRGHFIFRLRSGMGKQTRRISRAFFPHSFQSVTHVTNFFSFLGSIVVLERAFSRRIVGYMGPEILSFAHRIRDLYADSFIENQPVVS